MADKEVQNSKQSTVSALAGMKEPKPPNENSNASKTSSVKPGNSRQVPATNANMNEVLEILHVLNSNVNAQNEHIEKQEHCFNEFMAACNEPMEDDCNYDDCYDAETEHKESSIESPVCRSAIVISTFLWNSIENIMEFYGNRWKSMEFDGIPSTCQFSI
ncbi:hypothetical protein DPMN_114359 [Dreissena polymorpha]|uniref:Uncharacterized protein n=1 Tax=Dreissena polymorpha TaxID=45954 RepID=A0A9D4QRH5_DREPO|nr:hypothetical protein DPMN_114359 [Dreissena polymorpha]